MVDGRDLHDAVEDELRPVLGSDLDLEPEPHTQYGPDPHEGITNRCQRALSTLRVQRTAGLPAAEHLLGRWQRGRIRRKVRGMRGHRSAASDDAVAASKGRHDGHTVLGALHLSYSQNTYC